MELDRGCGFRHPGSAMKMSDPIEETEMPAGERAALLAELASNQRSIPPFDLAKLLAAIGRLRAVERMNCGASAIAGDFLRACLGKSEIDLSELCRLDIENSHAAFVIFESLVFHCGNTRHEIEVSLADEK